MDERLFQVFVQRVKGDAKKSNFMKAYCGKSTDKFDLASLENWEPGLPRRILHDLLTTGGLKKSCKKKCSASMMQS